MTTKLDLLRERFASEDSFAFVGAFLQQAFPVAPRIE